MDEQEIPEHSVLTLSDLRKLRLQGDPEAVRLLAAAFDDPNLGQQAAVYLGMIHTPEAMTALTHGLLHHPDSEIRALCASGLADHENTAVLPALLQSLNDADPQVVEWTCKALGKRQRRYPP